MSDQPKLRTAEDALRDPRPGDDFKKKTARVKVVTFTPNGCHLEMRGRMCDLPLWAWHDDNVKKWREWSMDAEVLHVAQEGGEG